METVIKELRGLKAQGLFESLQEVTFDMWDAYIGAARAVFGDSVRYVIDRFHVSQQFHDAISKARRQSQKKLPAELKEIVKGLRWVILKHPGTLTPDERERLAKACQHWPELVRIIEARDKLRQVFTDPLSDSPEKGRAALEAWIAWIKTLGIKALDAFLGTLTRWMVPIANYFRTHANNGRVEGFNNRLRTIMRRAFGIRNFEHFRLRVLDLLGGRKS